MHEDVATPLVVNNKADSPQGPYNLPARVYSFHSFTSISLSTTPGLDLI